MFKFNSCKKTYVHLECFVDICRIQSYCVQRGRKRAIYSCNFTTLRDRQSIISLIHRETNRQHYIARQIDNHQLNTPKNKKTISSFTTPKYKWTIISLLHRKTNRQHHTARQIDYHWLITRRDNQTIISVTKPSYKQTMGRFSTPRYKKVNVYIY